MVVVDMVYSQFPQVRARKLPGTTATNPWEHFESLLPVSLFSLCDIFPLFGMNLVKFIIVRGIASHKVTIANLNVCDTNKYSTLSRVVKSILQLATVCSWAQETSIKPEQNPSLVVYVG